MIPFFIPHVGCPHVCTFCNQSRITETSNIGYLTPEYITNTIEEYTSDGRAGKYWEVCFYGGSFSAILRDLQIQLLEPAKQALEQGLIDGIRCSTRPDAVDDEALSLLQSYGVNTIELGVQSMNDEVLQLAKRGHSRDDVEYAVGQLRKFNFTVGLQILPGLLGDSWHTILETAVGIVKLEPDFVRIYPVLVIEHTELADQYREGIYSPLSTKEAIAYCAFLKTYIENHHIRVIRTGLQSTEELDTGDSLIAGPYEPAMGELVVNEQWRNRIQQCIENHVLHFGSSLIRSNTIVNIHSNIVSKKSDKRDKRDESDKRNKSDNNKNIHRMSIFTHTIDIEYPRNLTSKIRGLKKRNITYFDKTYPHFAFTWGENNDISYVQCCIDGIKYML